MHFSILVVFILAVTSCSTKRFKNIPYQTSVENKQLQLNVFVPRNTKLDKMPVLIYVHGGNWNNGNKNIYGFFGRNFVKKQVVTVIADYTLSSNANYDEMAQEIAKAIQWTVENAVKYGGDPNKIFVTGHSAGGH